MDTTNSLPGSPGAAAPNSLKRNGLLAAGGAALVAVGLAAGLTLRSAPNASAPEPAATAAQTTAPGATPAPATAPVVASTMLANDGVAPPQPAAPTQPAAPVQAQAPDPAPAAAPAPAPAPRHTARNTSRQAYAAAACTQCGTVEAVHAVKVKGQGSGVGAVAGGVLGGALANQMGHGNGKAALTVLGAVGGAFGGNEVEKHVRATTAYDVTVRMQDGSVRTVRQQSAPAIGERVLVEGDTLRPDQRGG